MDKSNFNTSALIVKTNDLSGNLFIEVQGQISLWNCEELLSVFNRELDKEWDCIHFDFAGLDYMDTSGIVVLIEILKKSKMQNIKVDYHSFTDRMQSLISILGLSQVLIDQQMSCSI
jgi:anti-anti-sigma factor